MKKIILTAALAALLFTAAQTALAAAPEGCSVYTRPVVINTVETTALPNLLYKDIIYIPLDEAHQSLLGLEVEETGAATDVKNALTDEYRLVAAKAEDPSRESGEIAFAQNVSVNGEPSDYPFLLRSDVLYLPLTWSNMQSLGIAALDDGSELRLCSDSRFQTYRHETRYYFEKSYYVSSVDCCVKMVYDIQHFFSSKKLYYSLNGSDFTEIDPNALGRNPDVSLPEVYPDGNTVISYNVEPEMTLDGSKLAIKVSYMREWLASVAGDPESSAHDEYLLNIDLSSQTVTDATLVEVFSKNMYGLLERSDGSFLETPNPYPDNENFMCYAYYDGGHVILNGTMMRSYELFMYVGSAYKTETGDFQVVSGYPHPYWICAEDLENYGYDMVVDYENRATYFTRNPDKPVTPLGFDGTDEHLPTYESDWKIYIDGAEPRLYFNIGGYTLIYCGELGSLEEGSLDDDYKVMYVTTYDLLGE